VILDAAVAMLGELFAWDLMAVLLLAAFGRIPEMGEGSGADEEFHVLIVRMMSLRSLMVSENTLSGAFHTFDLR
jgi:hypothetical protein